MMQQRKFTSNGLAFIIPGLFFYLVFMIIPIIGTVATSFYNWSGYNLNSMRWTGISNYLEMIHDKVFWIALTNNLKLILLIVPLQCFAGLLVAILLERNLKFSVFFRGIYFLPIVVPFVVSGLILKMLLNPTLGLGSLSIGMPISFLKNIFATDWLGNKDTALYVVALIDIWAAFGYSMFLFVSTLKSIPDQLYEAATVDGASEFAKVRYITLPMLSNTVKLVIILASIDVMKVFTEIAVMTNGGPNYSTHALSTWTYFQAFTANQVGYASAIATVLLFISLIFSSIQLKMMRLK